MFVTLLYFYSAKLGLQAIEQKIFSLQEELTNMHRRKGEHAQQIVDLTSKLQQADKVLAFKEAKLVFHLSIFQLENILTWMFILQTGLRKLIIPSLS